MSMIRYVFGLTALAALIGFLVAQSDLTRDRGSAPVAPAGSTSPAESATEERPAVAAVRQAVEALAARPAARTGTVGFYLAPLRQSDQPLTGFHHQQSFITASTMKTITTGSALELLGPDFRFQTELRHHPATGDLLIKGAGDPTLGRPEWDDLFTEWTAALLRAGLREITGRVIADETAWESQSAPGGWSWLDIGNYYAPPLTPLCFHNNAMDVYFRLTGKPGDPAEFYDCDPWPDGLRFLDEVRIGVPGSGDNSYLYGAPGASRYVLRGTLAADAGKEAIGGALPDPALFAAQQFTAWLRAREIPVHGAPTTSRLLAWDSPSWTPPSPERASLIATHASAPLGEQLIPINHRSLNLDCECLLRTVGGGRARRGLNRLHEHLRQKGIPLAGYEQTDGSGLSRTNMITPEQLARANASFLTGPHGDVFRASLPRVGERRSTLRRLSTTGRAAIRAKSGTVERVKSYTGVVTAADGREYIFAILVNNYDGSYSSISPAMDTFFEALSGL